MSRIIIDIILLILFCLSISFLLLHCFINENVPAMIVDSTFVILLYNMILDESRDE